MLLSQLVGEAFGATSALAETVRGHGALVLRRLQCSFTGLLSYADQGLNRRIGPDTAKGDLLFEEPDSTCLQSLQTAIQLNP